MSMFTPPPDTVWATIVLTPSILMAGLRVVRKSMSRKVKSLAVCLDFGHVPGLQAGDGVASVEGLHSRGEG